MLLDLIYRARDLIAKYPARTISVVASAVVFLAARLGVVVPEQSVVHSLEFILPLILSGELTHRRVSPVG